MERRAYVESRLAAGETLEDALELLEGVDELGDFLEGTSALAAVHAFEPVLPEAVGQYRIERLLGWGSMGVVYLGLQDAPARRVAVKLLRIDTSSPTMALRFEREGNVLARLSHPDIATIFEAGVADLGSGPQPFLAMEYIDGQSIGRYADEHELGQRERVELVRRVALAVAHAHEAGVLHRDLKPDNILVRESGEPCVLDFGVAHTTTEDADRLTMTATGQVIGTLSYMAPEQARGSALDERADQFALGAILYELLTDELPFDIRGRLPHQALRIVADGECRAPSQHDPSLVGDLESILLTALAPEPARRYPSVSALAEDLARWAAGQPVRARPPSALESLLRFVARHRGLSAAVVLVLGAVGAGLAWATGTLLDLRREGEVSLLFSDLQLRNELELEASALWPLSRASLPAIEAWLERARALAGRAPDHRAAIARLELVEPDEAALTAAESVLGAQWLIGEAREFVDSMPEFEAGLLAEMEARRTVAADIHTITVEERRVAWREAARRVYTDPRFELLGLVPQEGLVPLGPDPHSGLEEFALWTTGTLPVRNALGSFAPRPEHALVLVLVPGGPTLIGAQRDDPAGANYDDNSQPHEGPPFTVQLDPFLISKFELTQAQWKRLFGFNPSDWEVGAEIKGRVVTELHPVESLSWEQALEYLPRVGVTLPTEAQWERAARGDLAVEAGHWSTWIGQVNWRASNPALLAEDPRLVDDGYFGHMPVGSLAPNPYGLCDVMGNVWELCVDTYKVDYHVLDHRPGDGLVLTEPDGDVSRRGQGSSMAPSGTRLYSRQTKRFDGRDTMTGLRPARALVLE